MLNRFSFYCFLCTTSETNFRRKNSAHDESGEKRKFMEISCSILMLFTYLLCMAPHEWCRHFSYKTFSFHSPVGDSKWNAQRNEFVISGFEVERDISEIGFWSLKSVIGLSYFFFLSVNAKILACYTHPALRYVTRTRPASSCSQSASPFALTHSPLSFLREIFLQFHVRGI